MLTRMGEGIKHLQRTIERRDVYIVLLILFVGGASFGLGRLSQTNTEERPMVRIENAFTEPVYDEAAGETTQEAGVVEQPIESVKTGSFVGSKNSDKYHFPWCPGAQRIKEENKVWFADREAAEAAGYTPAANCKGL